MSFGKAAESVQARKNSPADCVLSETGLVLLEDVVAPNNPFECSKHCNFVLPMLCLLKLSVHGFVLVEDGSKEEQAGGNASDAPNVLAKISGFTSRDSNKEECWISDYAEDEEC